MPIRTRTHWLVGVAERAGLACEALDGIAVHTPTRDAWAEVAHRCGVDGATLAQHVAAHFKLPVADLEHPEPKALKLVPESVARQYLVVPLRETDRNLVVATCNPTDLALEQTLGFASGRAPLFEVASPADLERAIDARYSPDRVVETLLGSVDVDDDLVSLVEEEEVEQVSQRETDTAPVVKLTNLILKDSVEQGASDVHIEPGRTGGRVRFRVDGVMRQYMAMPMPALNRVISRVKIISQIDIADRLRPQDGRARIRVNDQMYDLRISTVPTREAEKAVIRILNPEGSLALEEIGLPRVELARLRRLIGHRDGIVLVTGPTGSGKTTTLYAALREIATTEVNIMTVEDPVEYELPGTTQIQVERRRDVTFASALRAILRQDPDVILVGEIRDLETAEVAVQASLTGHLVLATLHTNDAVGTIYRLHDLGIDRAAIAESLRGALAQRLARRLCQCAQPVAPADLPEREQKLSRLYAAQSVMQPVGCETCGQTGYRGRVPLLEVAVITDEMQDLIVKGSGSRVLTQAAITGGMRGIREVALERVRDGTTTLDEVDRVLGESLDELAAVQDETSRVMLVDDDAVVRALAKRLMMKAGYEVTEVDDGLAALDLLEDDPTYSALILDLNMPKIGGREVLRRVRAAVATAGLPVIILTGTEDEDLEIRLIEEGADDYIRKPIDPPRFVARVRAALRRAGA